MSLTAGTCLGPYEILAFPTRGADGRQVLGTRLLDRSDVALLDGTDGADQPFFSPDGQWIGFFAEGKLKKVSVQGGTPVVLCETSNPRGASWVKDDTIVAALVNTSVGMVQRRGRARFVLEPPAGRLVAQGFHWQQLERHVAAEALIAGPVDDAHGAGVESLRDAILRDVLPDHGVRCSRRNDFYKRLRG